MDKRAVTGRLIRFEGSTPYMYRCTGGEVTVGIGHAIHGAEEALALDWGGPRTSLEQDYARIATAPMGQKYAASYYEPLTTTRMADDAILALCDDDINLCEDQLAQALPDWDSYPELVRQALFDMGYNLGVAGLLKFEKMLAAVNAGDWKTAAQESRRKGIAEGRNKEIEELFLGEIDCEET
jgi:GH24 family phage-related lysozyme (muramidase)